MRSLRTRLFCGLAVLIVASCVGAGVWAFSWSFDEAIELQDAILLQIGALVVRNHVDGELPTQPGVDAEARIIIRDIPAEGVHAEGDIGPSVPIDLKDGLHTLDARGGAGASWSGLGPTAAVWQSHNRPPLAMSSRGIVRYGLCCPCWYSYPVSCYLLAV